MLLLITGKTQSGKSTAVERLTRTALQSPWSHVLIIDGKTGQMTQRVVPNAPQCTATSPVEVAQALTAAAERAVARCTASAVHTPAPASAAAPADAAAPAPAHELLVLDGVETYTRNPEVSTAVRTAISRIFERAAALGDLVILVAQRPTGAVPPSARDNASAELRLLGAGFFQLLATGYPARQGRVDPAAVLAPPAMLTPERLSDALCGPMPPRAPTFVTRYEGLPGSGRTYALRQHQGKVVGLRRIELDVKALAHKALILACLEQCGATTAPGAASGVPELVEAAIVALQACPTLLLLDNVDQASSRLIDTLQRLIDASSEAAVALTPPPRNAGRDYPAPIRRRAALVELRPLDRSLAQALVRHVAPALDAASTQAVVQRADGNPQAIIAFTERVVAHGAEERHRLEGTRPPSRWLNLLLMFAVLVVVILIQRNVAHDGAGAVLSAVVIMTMWLIRPRFREVTRS